MNAEALRRALTDEDLERLLDARDVETTTRALRAIVDRLADRERVFEATESERERAAVLAALLLSESSEEAAPDETLRAALGAWHEKAAVAEERMRRGAWTPAHLFGRVLAACTPKKKNEAVTRTDAAVSRALVVSLRETLLPGIADLQNELHRLEYRHDAWEPTLRRLLGHYAGNARAVGASREEAALRTLAASAVRKGELMCAVGSHRALALALGAAATVVLKRPDTEEQPHAAALRALVHGVARENDARSALWENGAAEDARMFGAAAALAAFGNGRVSPPLSLTPRGSTVSFRLPEAWHERFSHVAAADAADALAAHANDPRVSEAEKIMAESLSETLRAHPSADRVSFSDALDIAPAVMRTGAFQPGSPLYRASTRGAVPTAIFCAGKRGRPLRCRAVASTDGTVVGYRAFDLLSRELGGRPVYALYDLEGQRYGYAWTEDGAVVRSGTPPQGFMTAPETISL